MSSRPIELDGQSLAISVLSVTACILFVGFLLVTTLAPPAQAIGMNDSAGDYKMLTQQLSSSSEALVVIDAAAQRMIVYGFDPNRRQFQAMSGFDFDRLQKRADPEAAQPPPGWNP
jgi:hypothetical protein